MWGRKVYILYKSECKIAKKINNMFEIVTNSIPDKISGRSRIVFVTAIFYNALSRYAKEIINTKQLKTKPALHFLLSHSN